MRSRIIFGKMNDVVTGIGCRDNGHRKSRRRKDLSIIACPLQQFADKKEQNQICGKGTKSF